MIPFLLCLVDLLYVLHTLLMFKAKPFHNLLPTIRLSRQVTIVTLVSRCLSEPESTELQPEKISFITVELLASLYIHISRSVQVRKQTAPVVLVPASFAVPVRF